MSIFNIIKISCTSELYPRLLREIHNSPPYLYARGNINLLESRNFAVVGTRRISKYGHVWTERLTAGLVSYQLTIVSGLALGVDAIAHRTALNQHGKTIAVLAGGIDHIHPTIHRDLAKRILANEGLILSEHPPGTQPRKYHFPQRNRIVSGLCIGTLVTEAPIKSGALITARHAFEQNRDVFTIPSDLSRSTCSGNHKLIAQDMARLIRTPEDIIAHLNQNLSFDLKPISKTKKSERSLETDAQKEIWGAIGSQSIQVEDLLKSTSLSISEISVALIYLELKGYIKNLGHGQYIRAP